VTDMVECGPGKVLSGLIKRIDKNVNTDQIGSAQAERLSGQRS
jgi:malonyl CoA-acyl carrier protein transacylase